MKKQELERDLIAQKNWLQFVEKQLDKINEKQSMLERQKYGYELDLKMAKERISRLEKKLGDK